MSAASSPPLTLIVAATVKNGIGKNGTLPWPMLKKEMAYFARVTKRVLSSSSSPVPESPASETKSSASTSQQQQQHHPQNVVIMGRKTWDSIPPKFRPLPHRTNVVISRQPTIPTISPDQIDSGAVLISSSIASALSLLTTQAREGKSKPVGRVFVIGGGAIYKAALEMESARHVLLTRVQGDWDCDTEFPVDLDAETGGWKRKGRGELEGFVEEEFGEAGNVLEEVAGGVKVGYEFMLYERE